MNEDRLDDWRAALEARIAALDAQIRPLQAELEKTRQQLDLVRKLLQLQGARDLDVPAGSRPELPPPDHVGPDGSVADVIAAVLAEAGEPLHISEIRTRFLATGRAVPGQGTDSNLIAYITRSTRFERVAKGTYRLARVTREPPASRSRPRVGRKKRRRSRRR
jgi:hypothetical protein